MLRMNPLPDFNAGESEESQGRPEKTLTSAICDVDESVGAIYNALPPSSVLIVVTGVGNCAPSKQ